jgi:hypothetical protein
MDGLVWRESHDRGGPEMISVQIDDEGWAKFPELEEYAEDHGITLSEAIERLVNAGLSHPARSS